MQENEFEKQVQKKMEELKMNPSEAVWQKVELQIRKRKTKKSGIILLLVLFLCVLYGAYMQTTSVGPINTTDRELANDNQNHQKVITKILTSKPYKTSRYTGTKLSEKNKIILSINSPKVYPLGKKKFSTYTEKKPDVSLIKYLVSEKDADNKNKKGVCENLPITFDHQNKPEEYLSNNKTDTSAISGLPITKDSMIVFDLKQIEKKSEKELLIVKRKERWMWSFMVSTGLSGVGTHLFDYEHAPNAASLPTIPGVGIQPRPFVTPSAIKPSIGFATGIAIEKKLSKIITFSTGLSYNFYSTTNKIGTDSMNYYRVQDLNSYHNGFHYLQLPVEFKLKIFNDKNLQVNWNTGIVLSQLVSSNALQFNNSIGFYYHDNRVFNRTQFGFSSGLNFYISQKSGKYLNMSPYFAYSLSKMANGGLYDQLHINFLGLQTKDSFRKRQKSNRMIFSIDLYYSFNWFSHTGNCIKCIFLLG